MDHKKWEAYLSLCRKVETGGRNSDANENLDIRAEHQRFVDLFLQYLRPPARVLTPGGMDEAVLLAKAGFETHALVLGIDNVAWLNARKAKLPDPSLLVVRELDAHDLDYPPSTFDGYFSVQFHEHLLAPFVHLGEVRFCTKDGAIAFVDAAGTTSDAMRIVWHTNLVPEQQVLEQWEFWGWKERWRGSSGDGRPQFVFELGPLLAGKYGGYLQHIMRLRAGGAANYAYNCLKCGR